MKFWDFHTHNQENTFAIVQSANQEVLSDKNCSVGIHPWMLTSSWESEFTSIEQAVLTNSKVLAIGECGFDRIKGPELELQKAAFLAQAKLANSIQIPLILHCVKAHEVFLEYLKKGKNTPAIIWHGWNLKSELAAQILNFPVYFSFGKAILHPDSNAAAWLKKCPIEKVFFETDDSGLEISEIYQAASLILGLPMERLAIQVVENWNRISSRKIQ